ncbi:unnamed protein product [Phytophthora fragariaefolia]|uniref:Unnamed protein product n=1 Tax=Phytophthora fragariaefolia TaxID=1490495 RepID=A0A9W7CSH0_9STRA|nr:unnamed protein product [Phytophthora fragariaefolia]
MPPPVPTITEASATRARSFPTPFKCSGDFCGFAWKLSLADASASSHHARGRRAAAPPPQASAASALSLLFPKEELRALGDANLSRLVAAMEVAQSAGNSIDGKQLECGELRVITYKSVALGRGNREHLQKAMQVSTQARVTADTLVSPTKARRQSHLLDSTLSQELRENSRSRVYGEMDGVANYYRQVRVCADCYAVYALLDLARQMTVGEFAEEGQTLAKQKQQQLKRKEQQMNRQRAAIEEKWEMRVEQEVRDKEAILLRKYHDGLKQKPEVADDKDTVDHDDTDTTLALPALSNRKGGAKRNSNTSKIDRSSNSRNEDTHTTGMPPLQNPEINAASLTSLSKPIKATAQLSATNQQQKELLRNHSTYVGMDNYLRGVAKRIENPSLEAGQLFKKETTAKDSERSPNLPGPVTILLVSSNTSVLDELHQILRTLTLPNFQLEIESMTDGRQALRAAQDFDYDIILIERELSGSDITGLEFSRLLRQSQLKRRIKNNFTTPTTILCVSSQTAPDDLQLYKDSGMDGCIGVPITSESLHHTLQAAIRARKLIPYRERPSSSSKQLGEVEALALTKAKQEQQTRHRRRRRRLEASHTLSMPGLAEMDARDDYVHGVFQMDAETAIPFCIMGGTRTSSMDNALESTDTCDAFFNLVVVHDLFDTWERLQILLQPLVARYRGRVQILLWNYPGQAYTAWRRGTLLHNTFHLACLSALLGHVTGASGSERLLRDKPYHLVGIGNGGIIAMNFCCSSQPRDVNTRSLVLLNSFAHVDAQLAQFLHDNAKVLACTPESRPDLPVYFHARFLFSASYLARVSTPLALNLYTAVLNPITLEGRQALTLGALAHHDLRTDLKRLRVPLISVCSVQNVLVDAGGHADTILALANLELVDSVGKVLRYRRVKSSQQQHSAGGSKRPSCVIWLPGGHEALQECKQDVLVLLEQLVTGFHELNDVPHGTSRKLQELSPTKFKSRCEDEQLPRGPADNQTKSKAKSLRNFEDAFIDRVLTTVKGVVPSNVNGGDATARPQSSHYKPLDGTQWRIHQQKIADQALVESSQVARAQVAASAMSAHLHSPSNQNGASKMSKLITLATWDPTMPAFERLSANVVYQPGAGSKIYPLLPEVKEYMGWRSQGLTFGKQLLLEYKLYGTKLQSDVALLAREKGDVEAEAEKLVKEICEFDEGIRLLEAELLALGKAETDNNASGGVNRTLDETAKWALREQKMRLDREFSQMLAQIAQRREKLATLEETLDRVDQERLRKEEELKALERKLVLLLEEQQKELARIREKQETRSQLALDLIPPGSVLTSSGTALSSAVSPAPGSVFLSSPVAGGPTTLSPTSSALGPGSGFPSISTVASGARPSGPAAAQGFSQQQRQEAASLMESTETMMKFGFMSMSMTYFSSMNMVRAMRKIGAHHLTLDSAAAVSQHRWPENSAAETPSKAAASFNGLAAMNPAGFQPSIPPGGFPGQQPLQTAGWSVSDVGRWLDTLALAQYKRAFADATVDGALLLHLTDDDLRNSLGMEHHLHRKKVLTTVEEMRVRERNQLRQLYGDNLGGITSGPAISDAAPIPSNIPLRPMPASAASPVSVASTTAPASYAAPTQNPNEAPAGGGRVVVSFSEFCSLVRHGKAKQIREALQEVPERKFDPLTIKTQFAPGTGTIYNDQLEKSVFHINKGDDNGNSPLLLAAQNNHLKVAQLLLSKGANPDHQNSHGHTAGHYAMAYSFFDLGAWLLDPDKGGGRDDILNENGLTAYDGLN